MKASEKTAHSNAYLFGVGKNKRNVKKEQNKMNKVNKQNIN